MAQYWGASQLAEGLGVATGTITKWINRFADALNPFPAPDVEIVETDGRVTRGWSPDRWDEIDQWHKQRQGKTEVGNVVMTRYSAELFSYEQPPVRRPRSPDNRRGPGS
ncbi:hypothetical protein [Actinophytocola sp. KF-1]